MRWVGGLEKGSIVGQGCTVSLYKPSPGSTLQESQRPPLPTVEFLGMGWGGGWGGWGGDAQDFCYTSAVLTADLVDHYITPPTPERSGWFKTNTKPHSVDPQARQASLRLCTLCTFKPGLAAVPIYSGQ